MAATAASLRPTLGGRSRAALGLTLRQGESRYCWHDGPRHDRHFSRASQLSIKTLRHYHDVGLLEPSEVDPGNGYRYYAEDQIPVAQVIRRLRGLQMPIADVKAVIAEPHPEARNRLIVAHLDRLEAEVARTRLSFSSCANCWNDHKRRAPCGIGRCRRPQQSRSRTRSTERTCWPGGREHSESSARSSAPSGLQPAGPVGGMYASDIFQHGRGDATVFIPTDGHRPGDRTRRTLGRAPGRARDHAASWLACRCRPHLRRTRRPRHAARNQH